MSTVRVVVSPEGHEGRPPPGGVSRGVSATRQAEAECVSGRGAGSEVIAKAHSASEVSIKGGKEANARGDMQENLEALRVKI